MIAPSIRLATADDAAAVATIYAPYVRDTAISFETDPPGTTEMARRIGTTLDRHPWLVAESAGTVLGYAYATEHRTRAAYRWSVDVSVYLDAGARHAGIGSRLYRVLLDLLAAQRFRQVFAGITLPNDASVGLHRSLGFTHVGTSRDVGHKLGRWYDVAWWQRGLGGPAGEPAEPVPLPALDAATVARCVLREW